MKNKKELKVIIGIVLVVLFIAGLSYLIPKLLAKPSQKLRVLKNGEILLEHDIKKDAKFMILDQEAKEVPFEEILQKEKIYDGKGLINTECGFSQDLSSYFIKYEVCDNYVKFVDNKNKIRVIIKELK